MCFSNTLWNNRKELRYAVVKPSYQAAIVAQNAVALQEYQERDPQRSLPVLLLIEDSDKEFLEVSINVKRILYGRLCLVLLSCRRSHDLFFILT